MKYKILLRATVDFLTEIEAKSEYDAREEAWEQWENAEADDFGWYNHHLVEIEKLEDDI